MDTDSELSNPGPGEKHEYESWPVSLWSQTSWYWWGGAVLLLLSCPPFPGASDDSWQLTLVREARVCAPPPTFFRWYVVRRGWGQWGEGREEKRRHGEKQLALQVLALTPHLWVSSLRYFNTDSTTRFLGFKPQLCHLLVTSYLADYLCSLWLSFLISKMPLILLVQEILGLIRHSTTMSV